MLPRRIRVFIALILREMTTRYGRSIGGYAWAILEPVAFIAILSIVFSQLTRDPALGRSFPLFFATGVTTFWIYRDIAEAGGGAYTVNRPLFAYPHISILDAVLARATLQLLTQICVAMIVFVGIFLIEDIHPHFNPGPILAAFGLAALIGLGVGMLNCTLFSLMPTWKRIYSLINRPLFILSGIFFTPEMLPAHIREILLLNPLVHIIGLTRTGFYPTYSADYISWPLIIATPLLLVTVALIVLRRYQGFMVEQ